MLSTEEAMRLIEELKELLSLLYFAIPSHGSRDDISLRSLRNPRESFTIIFQRRSTYHPKRYTIVLRYGDKFPLLHLDINHLPHPNPDGTFVEGDHLHIYKEDYDCRFAYPLSEQFSAAKTMVENLYSFMVYSNVTELNSFVIASEFDMQ